MNGRTLVKPVSLSTTQTYILSSLRRGNLYGVAIRDDLYNRDLHSLGLPGIYTYPSLMLDNGLVEDDTNTPVPVHSQIRNYKLTKLGQEALKRGSEKIRSLLE